MGYLYLSRNYLNLFKKINISSPILKTLKTGSREAVLDQKMDEIIRLLAEEKQDAEKIHELRERFNRATSQLPAYKQYNIDLTWKEKEMDIILSNVQTKTYKPGISKAGQIRKACRMIISILLIALGFAMIILPTPAVFEIYTLFYFNHNDGFTVMDLISLIIVFCGIYTLVTIDKKK